MLVFKCQDIQKYCSCAGVGVHAHVCVKKGEKIFNLITGLVFDSIFLHSEVIILLILNVC